MTDDIAWPEHPELFGPSLADLDRENRRMYVEALDGILDSLAGENVGPRNDVVIFSESIPELAGFPPPARPPRELP